MPVGFRRIWSASAIRLKPRCQYFAYPRDELLGIFQRLRRLGLANRCAVPRPVVADLFVFVSLREMSTARGLTRSS
jgi:hypothetical protein